MEDTIRLYNELGNEKVDLLYRISCLKASDSELSVEEIKKLAPILYEMWLKDENNTCYSSLSDMLVNVKDIITDNMSIRQILVLAYTKDLEDKED